MRASEGRAVPAQAVTPKFIAIIMPPAVEHALGRHERAAAANRAAADGGPPAVDAAESPLPGKYPGSCGS